MASIPEVWLRGSIPDIIPDLQPVAHALLQAREDVERLTEGLAPDALWTEPGKAASIGFHVRHMAGALDRLMTYARGEALSDAQREALDVEKLRTPDVRVEMLLTTLYATIDRALSQLRSTVPEELEHGRAVGRAGHPSTVRGLLHHAGEHTARHAGQISTTMRVLG
ncbi:MAG: DinB family protein [Bacteroidia bacterium]|nr:DinB family protein [Bacteroidia bacterium]